MKPTPLALRHSPSLLAFALLGLAACKPAAAPAPEAAAPVAEAPAAATPPAPAVAPPAMQSAPVQPELAATVNAQIDTDGAAAAGRALAADPLRLRQAVEAIASADPVWLTIALRLRKDAAPGLVSTLSDGLAQALPNAPERVLALAGQGYSLDQLCRSPAGAAGEAHRAKTRAALESVTEPALLEPVQACLQRLR